MDFRSAYDHLPCQAWTATPDGLLDYVNPRTLEYFGISAERLLARGWQDVCHPQDLILAKARWAAALETGRPYEHTFRLLRSDQRYFWHLARARAVRDAEGAITRWVGTNEEIDAIKRAEEIGQAAAARAIHQRKRLEDVFARLPVALIVLTAPDLRVERVNPLARSQSALAQPEYQAYAEAFPTVAQVLPIALVEECARDLRRHSLRDIRLPLAAPAGAQEEVAIPASVHCLPLEGEDGKADGVVVVLAGDFPVADAG